MAPGLPLRAWLLQRPERLTMVPKPRRGRKPSHLAVIGALGDYTTVRSVGSDLECVDTFSTLSRTRPRFIEVNSPKAADRGECFIGLRSRLLSVLFVAFNVPSRTKTENRRPVSFS